MREGRRERRERGAENGFTETKGCASNRKASLDYSADKPHRIGIKKCILCLELSSDWQPFWEAASVCGGNGSQISRDGSVNDKQGSEAGQ